jgi:aspartokinase/homoserine dehydrogenase 1
LDSLSYHEAWELSYFGASVLHPRTTMPAMKYDIPITIRNFFNRTAAGEFHLTVIRVFSVGRHQMSCQ